MTISREMKPLFNEVARCADDIRDRLWDAAFMACHERSDGSRKWETNGLHDFLDKYRLINHDGYGTRTTSRSVGRRCGPTVIEAEGTRKWAQRSSYLSRKDGPAVEYANGDKAWYRDGLLHREDGPALVRTDGTKAWFLAGSLHREDGPAIEKPDGTKIWALADFLYDVKHLPLVEVDIPPTRYVHALTEEQHAHAIKHAKISRGPTQSRWAMTAFPFARPQW